MVAAARLVAITMQDLRRLIAHLSKQRPSGMRYN
jgi:hypothetical protein